MLILSCSSKLRLLEGTLQRGFPNTLPVYGTVMAINRGNPAAQEVLVDSWPDFKVVLTRPRREVASDDSDFYTNTYTVYYRDLGAHRALLGSADAVNWGQTFCILGLQDGAYEVSKDIAEAKGIKLEVLRYFTYFHPDPSSMPEIRLDLAMRLSSLDVSHADLLNETWAFGGNEKSRKYLASVIRHFPSVCLLDAAGHLVSWAASYPFGAIGLSYTLPQHRQRGYMGMLNNLIAKRLHALGYPSYGYVAMENYPMQRLQERQGFQRQPNLCYFILHNPAAAKAPTLTPSPAQGTAPT
ncbi:glycine N-acyltransferase-like protein 3 [Trachemys scripta elegans]|uniref:glycine N-acyltransferase-like protein 3 n=1 Tax=Trachemys scripta elegans TaxID=31138 RepID=UPI0015533A38|nr:glycine N-acyltransferase-like protein 3 [Trachemys scripta elegans]